MNKRILYISNTSWYLYNFRHNIMEIMLSKGYDIYAVAPFDDYSDKLIKLGVKYIDIEFDRSDKSPVSNVRIILKLITIYNKIKPDILHQLTIKPVLFGTIAARIVGLKKIINSITGLGNAFANENLLKRFIIQSYRIVFNSKSVSVIFQNPDDMGEFLDHSIASNSNSTLILGSGVNTSEFKSTGKSSGKGKIRFSIFCRMSWEKGVNDFIEAAKKTWEQNKNTEYFLVGGIDEDNPKGISEAWLQNAAKHPAIHWTSFVDDVFPWLEKSDIVVLPSLFREGVPRSLIEAASMEKPIIATNVPGCREIVDDGVNGILIPSGDVRLLAESMLRLSEDVKLREQMGRAGRDRVVKYFDEKIVISKTIQLYEK